MVASVVSKTRGGLCIDMMQLPCLCTYVLLTVAKIGKISAASEAKKLYEKLSNLKDVADIKVEDTLSQIGGGSLPTEKIKSKCISIVPKNISTTSLEEQLRLNENPVVARISDDKLIIDMRCILEDEIEILAEKIINILK